MGLVFHRRFKTISLIHSSQQKDSGTGLGLSVTKKIIQNHNGTLKMTSNEDGTTFTISIPILPKTALERLNQYK